MTIEQTQMSAGDYTYEVRRAGDGDDLVILLHGFPETSHMWLPLLEHLAGNGYTALAPDLRGYSPGAMPRKPSTTAMPRWRATFSPWPTHSERNDSISSDTTTALDSGGTWPGATRTG